MSNIDNQYLLFEVDEEYALPLPCVMEIIEYTEITPVPETPDYISGIINLRGHVIPVIDVRKRFMKAERDGSNRRCIIIAKIADNTLGLIVDNVIDLIEIAPEMLRPSPQVGSSYVHVFIKYIGIDDSKMHLIIDTDKLVNYNDLFFLEESESVPHAEESEVPAENQ